MDKSVSQTIETIFLIVLFVAIVVQMWAAWRIAKQAGYSGASSLWLLVPIVGVVMIFVFAFSTWPVTRRLEEASSTNNALAR